MTVALATVGGTSELAVVGPPGVGRLDDPPQTESETVRLTGLGFGAAPLNVEIGEPAVFESGAHDWVVVARPQPAVGVQDMRPLV